jgi:hypothetical protein
MANLQNSSGHYSEFPPDMIDPIAGFAFSTPEQIDQLWAKYYERMKKAGWDGDVPYPTQETAPTPTPTPAPAPTPTPTPTATSNPQQTPGGYSMAVPAYPSLVQLLSAPQNASSGYNPAQFTQDPLMQSVERKKKPFSFTPSYIKAPNNLPKAPSRTFGRTLY